MYPTGNRTWGEAGDGGFIGTAHSPVGLVAKDPNARAQNMTLRGMSLDRLMDRESLRSSIDQFRRDADNTGAMSGLDTFTKQGLEILSGSGLANALDLSKEDPGTLDRYGVNDPKYQRDGAPKMIRNFLVARRPCGGGSTCGFVELLAVGLARRRWTEFSPITRGISASGSRSECLDYGFARSRHAGRCLHRDVGRVRKDSENQQDE